MGIKVQPESMGGGPREGGGTPGREGGETPEIEWALKSGKAGAAVATRVEEADGLEAGGCPPGRARHSHWCQFWATWSLCQLSPKLRFLLLRPNTLLSFPCQQL